MTKLSAAAQAVLDAYQSAPIEDELTAAAVIYALASQMLTCSRVPSSMRDYVRTEIIAIAIELEKSLLVPLN